MVRASLLQTTESLQELRGIPPRRCAAGVPRISRRDRSFFQQRLKRSKDSHFCGYVGEMAAVLCRQCRMVSQHDSGNHGVAQVPRETLPLPRYGEICREPGCFLTKNSDAMVDRIKKSLELLR